MTVIIEATSVKCNTRMLRNSPSVGMRMDVGQLLHNSPLSTIFSTVNVLTEVFTTIPALILIMINQIYSVGFGLK